MIIRTGLEAKRLLREARRLEYSDYDPLVYDYIIHDGVVLIRKRNKECMYIKTSRGCRMSIAMQGHPEEFMDCLRRRTELEATYKEMKVVDWLEIKEMVTWAPSVPR